MVVQRRVTQQALAAGEVCLRVHWRRCATCWRPSQACPPSRRWPTVWCMVARIFRPASLSHRTFWRSSHGSAAAPLHQPHNLEGVRAFQKVFPDLPQIACFDTAFHATLSEVDYAFAARRRWPMRVCDAMAFMGRPTSSSWNTLLEQTPRARGRVLMAHLGNGASRCAAREGKAVPPPWAFRRLMD